MEPPPIDISPLDWEIVRAILQRHIPEHEVWAFGSRATWTAREYSDLDLAVVGDKPLPLAVKASLAEDFEESDLPFKVDVVDWATTKERFRRIIEKDRVVVREAARAKARGRLGVASERLVGPAPDDWEYTTLGAACERGGGDIQTGPFGTQLHASDYVDVGIPSIMPANIGDNRIIEDGIARITPDDARRLSRYLVQKGDIICSRRGDVERRALVREPEDGWLCGTGCLRVRLGKQGVDPGYASYYLGHPSVREWIVRHAHGATMLNLNTSILSACPFLVPPPEEQRAIAHILGTLDDKIELNRRMNETLEAMARALFKSWFVDFDPVRAKMDGRWRPGQSLPGLPAHLCDLFPDRLVPSEVDEIPEGWEVGTVGDLAGLSRTGLQPGEFPNEVFDHCSIPAHDEGRMPKAERGEAIKSNKLLVLPECVLLSKLNPRIPRAWLPNPQASRRSICSTEFLVAVPKRGISREFLYCLFSSDTFIAEFSTLVTGTSGSHQRVRPQAFLALALVLPPKPLVRHFTQVASRFLRRVAENRGESRSLTALRDTLLPKVISGKLRVPDVGQVAARAEA